MLRKVKRLRDGEEIELDHAVDAIIDYKIGLAPSDRIYQNRERRARDIATCFLLDLSASTDEWVVEEPRDQPAPRKQPHTQPHPFSFFPPGAPEEVREELSSPEGAKRVIDIEREALIIMAEALEHLGDEYAIYGFSGYGKENVEFLPLKKFSESYSDRVRRRIGAIEPRKSTRMGPAIRHAIEKLGKTGRKMKILILLSDGYPQDFDYGPDRSSREYGLHDTAVALREARKRDIHTFLITVDQAGNDYLYDMCGGRDYFVVKRPSSLPKILPRIYRKLTF
jgi:nitric oxide reductase activation protein